MLPIRGLKNVESRSFANNLHPKRAGAVRQAGRGPVGEIASDDNADILMPVHEFDPTFHPRSLVYADHESRLIVEVVVLAGNFDGGGEVSFDSTMQKVA